MAAEREAFELRPHPQPNPDSPNCRPLKLVELHTALMKLPNRKAPGGDGMPAEILKRGGRAGELALLNLMNVVWCTGCVPQAWRKGEVVCVFKADDPLHCNNYRPLTMLAVLDKLFALLLEARLGVTVTLHDQQYTFRRARGTYDALFGLSGLLRSRARRGMPTFAAFFDAHKAYDTVNHASLLSLLADKGVTGALWRLVDKLYADAHSAARVEGHLSAAYAVRRGVAQGCPLSPFLYDVFADSLLSAIYRECAADGVPVDAESRTEPASAYADDLKALASMAAGLQRIIDAVRRHSLRYGWTLNVTKTVVLVFGTALQRAEHAGAVFRWGDAALPRAPSAKYLGVVFHEGMTWDLRIAQAVRKGWAAYHAWAPVLASTRIHVATKKRLIDTHVRPSMKYALEIWGSPLIPSDAASLQPLDVVLTAACRLACGVRASPAMHAWERRAGVKPDVLLADMGELPMQDVALIATLSYAERVRMADTGAAALTQHDDGSPAFETALPAHKSPDFMHAALRRALPPDDAWVCRVAAARAAVRTELGTIAPAPGR